MELNSRHQWYVGLFVILGLGLIMASIIMLGADRSFMKTFVTLRAQFSQVQGLSPGSIVSLAGVRIGNVEEIHFLSETNQIEILMKIEEEYLARITRGSLVDIRTQGALGDKFIFVSPGPHGTERVKPGDSLEVAPTTDILDIISQRGQETERVFDIINEVHKMAKTINANNRLEKTMSDVAKTSANLSEASFQMKKFANAVSEGSTQAQLKGSIEKLDHILTKLDQGKGTLGALINDSSLHSQLKNFLGGSQRKEHLKNLLRTSIEKTEENSSSSSKEP